MSRLGLLSVIALGFSFLPPTVLAQSPMFATQTPAVANEGTTVSILLPVVNVGTGTATAVQATSITLGQLEPTTPSSLPLLLGDMAPGDIGPLNLAFVDTSLVIGNVYLLTVRGTYVVNGTTFGFTVNRFIKFGVPTIFQLPPNPLNVTPTPDNSHAVTQFVSAANGGTISATGADGTVFTATFPSNALLGDEIITMTPVVSVAGAPISGGVVAGVQLTPDGLQLFQPAHLNIQPAGGVSIDQQVGFSYHGDGQEFFFYPLDPVTGINFTILQLSGYGLGTGNVTQRPIPTNLFDRLESEIERITAPQSQISSFAMLAQTTSTSGSQSIDIDEEINLLQDLWEQKILPELQQAEGPGGTLKSEGQALNDATAWAREVLIRGLNQDNPILQQETDEAQFTAPVTIDVKEWNQTYSLCFSQPGPAAVANLLRAERRILLISDDPSTLLGADYLQKIDNCANVPLTVDFASEGSNHFAGSVAPPGGLASSDSRVQAMGLILKWNNPTSAMVAGLEGAWELSNAPLSYLSLSTTDGIFSGAQFCTTVQSFSSGNSISVSAKPSINVLGDGTTLYEIQVTINPKTGELFIVGIIDPTSGRCVQVPTPIPFPVYQVALFGSAGFVPTFPLPLNSPPHTFKLAGSLVTNGALYNANVTVTLSVTAPNP
jgi:hypothetical protein